MNKIWFNGPNFLISSSIKLERPFIIYLPFVFILILSEYKKDRDMKHSEWEFKTVLPPFTSKWCWDVSMYYIHTCPSTSQLAFNQSTPHFLLTWEKHQLYFFLIPFHYVNNIILFHVFNILINFTSYPDDSQRSLKHVDTVNKKVYTLPRLEIYFTI